MSRAYSKPTIIYEDFSLSTSVANCEEKTNLPSYLACGLPLILPQMTARSLYLAGMLAFCCAGNAKRFAVAVVLELVSFCSYMQSIFSVTVLPMTVLSMIAIGVAAFVAVELITLIMTPEEAEA
jgi:hypothetical protein